MGLAKEVREICKVCGLNFMRDRALLDTLGTPDSAKVCSKCKEKQKEINKIEETVVKSKKKKRIKRDTL